MKRYPFLYQVLRVLRHDIPPSKPVILKRTKLDDWDGFCTRRRKNFLIRIDKTLNESHAIDTLLHEYAHVISHDDSGFGDHGLKWGKAYSKVYKCFIRNFEI